MIIIKKVWTKRTYLGGSGDHVLDEVTMSGGINDGHVVLRGLELPESDVDGDTTLTLGLQFVQHPGVLERALAGLLGLLLELLDGPLVDTSALVDQMTSGGGLAGVDVPDDNNVNMNLFLAHFQDKSTTRFCKRFRQLKILSNEYFNRTEQL